MTDIFRWPLGCKWPWTMWKTGFLKITGMHGFISTDCYRDRPKQRQRCLNKTPAVTANWSFIEASNFQTGKQRYFSVGTEIGMLKM